MISKIGDMTKYLYLGTFSSNAINFFQLLQFTFKSVKA